MSDFRNNHSDFKEAMKAFIAGLANALPQGVSQIVAEGQVSTVAEVTTELNGYVAVYQTADDAANAHAKAVKAREDIADQAITRFAALEAAAKAMLGKKSPDLTKVGMQPDKTPAPRTVQQKQDAAAKAQATRVLRGTKGKRQKAKIHGAAPAPTAPMPTPPAPGPTKPAGS